jgi:hypothetical protein
MKPLCERMFYSVFVWKYIGMYKQCFGDQLLQNPPLCSSTVVEHRTVTTSYDFWHLFTESDSLSTRPDLIHLNNYFNWLLTLK